MKITLEARGNEFIRNGEPHRIFSGALHYFRVHPAYWEDRMRKMQACGLNTVETYVAWNLHEPRPGTFDFSGLRDVRSFIETAGKLGLDVIFRPGPYICAEWELGGLPAWLLKEQGLRLRTTDPRFMDPVRRFFKRLFEELKGLQGEEGGPIVAIQVENEYGSYGANKDYLREVEKALQDAGATGLFFTSDGPDDSMLQGGTLPHLLKTGNFGSRGDWASDQLRRYQPEGPLMCMEFWNGWFDHWGKPHHVRSAEDAAASLDEWLSLGASVNLYMAHGGTNFGFWNGANHRDGIYWPTVSSYDYDAALDEQGRPTPKYDAFQKVFAKHGAKTSAVPPTVEPISYGSVTLQERAHLLPQAEALAGRVERTHDTKTMEELDQNYGYTLYRTHIPGPRPETALRIQDVRDRASVYLDGKYVGVLYRNTPEESLTIAVPEEGALLEIVVENLGRVNYGSELHDRKGITRGVLMGNQYLCGWEMFTYDFSELPSISWEAFTEGENAAGPAFYRAEFHAEQLSDTFLKIKGRHGAAWLNGFCLGRYWEIGPQETLYVPAPLLKQGKNELVILEVDPGTAPAASFEASPALGPIA